MANFLVIFPDNRENFRKRARKSEERNSDHHWWVCFSFPPPGAVIEGSGPIYHGLHIEGSFDLQAAQCSSQIRWMVRCLTQIWLRLQAVAVISTSPLMPWHKSQGSWSRTQAKWPIKLGLLGKALSGKSTWWWSIAPVNEQQRNCTARLSSLAQLNRDWPKKFILLPLGSPSPTGEQVSSVWLLSIVS